MKKLFLLVIFISEVSLAASYAGESAAAASAGESKSTTEENSNRQERLAPVIDPEIAKVLEKSGMPEKSGKLLSEAVQGSYKSRYEKKDATNWIVFQENSGSLLNRVGVILKQEEYRSSTAPALSVTVFWFDHINNPRMLRETKEYVELITYASAYNKNVTKDFWRNSSLFLGRKATDSEVGIFKAMSKGYPLIFIAAQKGDFELVQYLVDERGVDPNSPLNLDKAIGVTPLYAAAERGRLEVVSYLVGKGVDPSHPLESGRREGITPCFIAAANKHLCVIKYLEEEGYDLNLPLTSGLLEGHTPRDVSQKPAGT